MTRQHPAMHPLLLPLHPLSRPLAGALLGLCLALSAAAQSPDTRGTSTSTTSTSTTQSVMQQALPPIKLQPGAPSDGRPRVAEPAHLGDLQDRIDRLQRQSPVCPDDYHLAKAQAWLNFSRDQYHERAWQKDIQQTTFDEALRLVSALESRRDPGFDTPLVSDALRLRPDLWAVAERIRADRSGLLCCAARATAFCEVQLVWSGHALGNLGGWRRANPHVLMAEDLCQQAQASACVAPPPPPAPPAPVVAAAPPPAVFAPAYQKITLAASALFRHGQSSLADMLPAGRASLDDLAAKLKGPIKPERLLISGHSDITNHSADPAYNDKLSLARADTVRRYLAERGVDTATAQVAGRGAREPVKTDCQLPAGTRLTAQGLVGRATRAQAMEALEACLQPNRRVEIELFGTQATEAPAPVSPAPPQTPRPAG